MTSPKTKLRRLKDLDERIAQLSTKAGGRQ